MMNTNNWPFSAAGAFSPKRENYPAYMWIKGENPRGMHAVEVLSPLQQVTLDSLIAAGYDPHLTGFEVLLPPLFAAFDALAAADPRRQALAEPIAALRGWDRRTGAESVPTALAIFWAQEMAERTAPRHATPKSRSTTTWWARSASGTPDGAAGGRSSICSRLRPLADTVGPDQPLPAPHR